MDRNDRQAIEALFDKLAKVERDSPPRDAESEAFIREQISRQPGAPYYMAQTIVVQDQALAAAEKRIADLQGGVGRERPRGAVPSVERQPSAPGQQPGGFLAGAAQTALGVAGGWLLGNAIAGMFGSGKAEAAESGADAKAEPEAKEQEPAQEAAYEDADAGDDGFDGDGFGDFGDFDI